MVLLLGACASIEELPAAFADEQTPAVDTVRYRVRISSLTNPEIYQEVDLQLNEPTDVPGMEVRLTALEYFPNYSYSFSEKRPENLSDTPINPGLRMTMTTEGLTLPPFWLFSKRPQFRPFSRMPMHIIFLGQVEESE